MLKREATPEAWPPIADCLMFAVADGGFVPDAVLRPDPAVEAVRDELDLVAARHVLRRAQGRLLRQVIRQRAAALRHFPATYTIDGHMHVVLFHHDAVPSFPEN